MSSSTLKLYDLVMRALGRDDGQLVALFPLSSSGLAQQWFALLDPSRRKTLDDLAHKCLRQYFFSNASNVSRRELDALRQGSDKTVASILTRWSEKMALIIIDRPLEKERIQMVVKRLQPKIARYLIGIPFTDFTSLTSTLFGVEEGITRGLWPYSSPRDPKWKKPLVWKSPDVYTISS